MTLAPHGLYRAINFKKLGDLGPALADSWSKATCWSGCKKDYPDDASNPSFGNCLASVLLAWAEDGFKGKIVPCLAQQPGKEKPDWHFQEVRGGYTIDGTAQQFDPGTVIRPLRVGEGDYHDVVTKSLLKPEEASELRDRLGELMRRVEKTGYELKSGLTADQIVGRAQLFFMREMGQEFKPARNGILAAR